MCKFFQGLNLAISDSLGTLMTLLSLNTTNASRASAFDTHSKFRARLIGFVSVLSIFTISVPAHSKTQKHVYLWQLLAFLVFLVLKMVDK